MRKRVIFIVLLLVLSSCTNDTKTDTGIETNAVKMEKFNALDQNTINVDQQDTFVYTYSFSKTFYQIIISYKIYINDQFHTSYDLNYLNYPFVDEVPKYDPRSWILMLSLVRNVEHDGALYPMYLVFEYPRLDYYDGGSMDGVYLDFDKSQVDIDANTLELKENHLIEEIKDYTLEEKQDLGNLIYCDKNGSTIKIEFSTRVITAFDDMKLKSH